MGGGGAFFTLSGCGKKGGSQKKEDLRSVVFKKGPVEKRRYVLI